MIPYIAYIKKDMMNCQKCIFERMNKENKKLNEILKCDKVVFWE